MNAADVALEKVRLLLDPTLTVGEAEREETPRPAARRLAESGQDHRPVTAAPSARRPTPV